MTWSIRESGISCNEWRTAHLVRFNEPEVITKGDDMATNLERFSAAKRALDSRAEQAVIAALGSVPEQLWRLGGKGQNYDPLPVTVTGAKCNISGAAGKSLWFNKRPSREQVSEIEKVVDRPLDPDCAMLGVEWRDSVGATSAAVKLSDIEAGERFYLTEAEAAAEASKMREAYIAKDGQFCCQYCGRATDDAARVQGTIIARQYPGMRRTSDYCSQQCVSYDQMAHEG